MKPTMRLPAVTIETARYLLAPVGEWNVFALIEDGRLSHVWNVGLGRGRRVLRILPASVERYLAQRAGRIVPPITDRAALDYFLPDGERPAWLPVRRVGRAEVLPDDLKAAVGERAHNDMALSRSRNEMAGMKPSRRFVPVAVSAPMPPPIPAPAEPAPDFEAVDRRLTAPVLDRRPAAASLIHDVESPVLA
jgi:hypothetical protein